MENNHWERIAAVIAYSQMTVNAFARHIGLDNGEALYGIKQGVNDISDDMARRIADKFPEIDIHWLLCGEGGMFN